MTVTIFESQNTNMSITFEVTFFNAANCQEHLLSEFYMKLKCFNLFAAISVSVSYISLKTPMHLYKAN